MIVPSAEVVHNGPLILSLLPAPQAEGEVHLSLQSLGGVYTLETHYFGGFEGATVLKMWRSLADPLITW